MSESTGQAMTAKLKGCPEPEECDCLGDEPCWVKRRMSKKIKQEIDRETEQGFEQILGSPPDPAEPSEQEINNEQRRLKARRVAQEREAEKEAAEFASEWFGLTGEAFDPSTPEPVPFALEYGIDLETGEVLAVFPEGVSFLFGTRSTLKTWVVYFTKLQELRKGNWVLIIDYELSYEEAMRRFYTLADLSGEPLTHDQLRRLIYIQPSGPPSDAGKRELLRRFGGVAPTVVGIDSVGMGMGLSGLDENISKDLIAWGKELVLWLKREWPHTAIILVDHIPKSLIEATDPIGSQRKSALADSLFFIATLEQISRKTRGSGRLTMRKSRKGHGDENVPLLDFRFGGGGPFTVGPSDPSNVGLDLSHIMINAALRIAQHIGDHEGVKVAEARKVLRIGNDEFLMRKRELVAMKVIEHPSRGGLVKGPRWQEYIDHDGELVDDIG